MPIGLLINHWNPAPWLKMLRKRMGDSEVYLYPDLPEDVSVEFLACWRPESGQLSHYPDLQVIQNLGAGVDAMFEADDFPASAKVSRIVDPDLTHDMYEHALACILYWMKNFAEYEADRATRSWRRLAYQRMRETTVGVLGLGELGAYTAMRLAQQGFEVMGWSRSSKQLDGVQDLQGEEGLRTILAKADYIINLLPLTDHTRGILDAQFFALCQSSAVIINVGRGGHLEERDLQEALDAGKIRAASLDVFVTEPLPQEHPLWVHPKVHVTPHVASFSNPETAADQVVENYQRYLAGKPLLHRVDIDKQY